MMIQAVYGIILLICGYRLTAPVRRCQSAAMKKESFILEETPSLDNPVLIAGFEGWGNALSVAVRMIAELCKRLDAKPMGHLKADRFYRYDETRPAIHIQDGRAKSIAMPGGKLYFAASGANRPDLILLRADEPALHWRKFSDDLLDLCDRFEVSQLITLGSMVDQVLHTEQIISAAASEEALLSTLKGIKVKPINYEGPGGIHSLIQVEAPLRNIPCVSLWCHCPYYLQDTVHFGYLVKLGQVLSRLIGLTLDFSDLERRWHSLCRRIETLIQDNTKLQAEIERLRQQRPAGSLKGPATPRAGGTVIQLNDFIRPDSSE